MQCPIDNGSLEPFYRLINVKTFDQNFYSQGTLFTIRKLTDATYDAWEIWYVKLKNHSPKTWCYYEWNAKLILGNSEFFGSLIICHIWHLLFFNWQGKLFICH